MTDIRSLGLERLQTLHGRLLEPWKTFLAEYPFQAQYPDDPYAWLAATLALQAVAQGNFGVGAILVDGTAEIVAQGHNQVFHPHFRSDRHAEMVVMEGWEDSGRPGHVTLYTSLESCPMCLVRLCQSRVERIVHVAADDAGGMVQRLARLPPVWRELAQGKTFAAARCGPDIANASTQIFQINLQELMAKLRQA